MARCPLCNSDDVEPCDNGMVLCGPCNRAWYPERPQRLVDTTGLAADVALVRGACHPERLLIALDDRLPHTAKAETLLHEVVHACLSGTTLDDEAEETVCRSLGVTLLDVLRRNPELIAFLTGED